MVILEMKFNFFMEDFTPVQEKKKESILYVDDDKVNLELFYGLLSDDYDVILESSPSRAFDLLNSKKVKVIVSDQRMPEELGLSFLERVHQVYPDIIKIIYTAYLDHDAALQAVNQGSIFRYLLKPWNSEQMRITLESAIREYDLKHENSILLNELKHKNEALENALNTISENEQKFYGIFMDSSDGITIVQDEQLIEANSALVSILKMSNAMFEKYPSIKELLKHKFEPLWALLSRKNIEDNKTIAETTVMLEDGQKKHLELNSKIILYKNAEATLSIIRDITERKEHERKIMEAIVNTQEEEQRRYAQELHDGLGPILSTLKMYVEWLANPANQQNKETITRQTIVFIDEAINQAKSIANNLSPHILQRFGLVNTLETYCNDAVKPLGIECTISSNLTTRLPQHIEVPLYRVLMECINNTLKHAEAKKIIIRLRKVNNGLQINYNDNGKGFDIAQTLNVGKGMGLSNIRNRINLIDGQVKFISNPGIGTDIEIFVPEG